MKRRLDLASIRAADVVVIERQLFDDDSTEYETHVRRVAKRLVYDVDDAIHLGRSKKFETLWNGADRVIAGNQFLAESVRPYCGSVSVIPTSIDVERFQFKDRVAQKAGSSLTIGWTGTSSNLGQLAIIRDAIESVSVEHDVTLEVVCEDRPDRLSEFDNWRVPVRYTTWSREEEVAALSRFDIGVMPLETTPWNRGKCGFKLIQYLATGLSAVASDVGVNSEIADSGHAALLARSSEDWATQISMLCSNPNRRIQMGQCGRSRVESEYSIQANAARWIEAVLG